ncbi:MAG TPA: Na+/H+ antiporter subunit E [Magnetovibrio sp.]
MLHTLSLGVALTALWLLLSGIFTPLLLGLGLASIVVTLWLAHRMDVIDHEGHPIHLAPHALIVYWPWLAWQIVKSNWDMAKVILTPKMPIHPHVFTTKATQHTETGRTTYANSITLTPGTVTLSTSPDGTFEVHVITDGARRDVESLEMDKRCSALEGKQDHSASQPEEDKP